MTYTSEIYSDKTHSYNSYHSPYNYIYKNYNIPSYTLVMIITIIVYNVQEIFSRIIHDKLFIEILNKKTCHPVHAIKLKKINGTIIYFN